MAKIVMSKEPSKKRKEEKELIVLNLLGPTNLYITLYIVQNDDAKIRLLERLRILRKEKGAEIVELDVLSANNEDIHGAIATTKEGYGYHEKPRWMLDSPFMLLLQNLEKLSPQNRDHLTKLSKLTLYLKPFGDKPVQVPATLDENSQIAAIVTEQNLNMFEKTFNALGQNAKGAFSVRKVRENNEGLWESCPE